MCVIAWHHFSNLSDHCRGSGISRIVGTNVKENPGFHHIVKMWVYEEMVDGKKLTEIINEKHENVKYLKGFTIPDNVVSIQTTSVQTSTQ